MRPEKSLSEIKEYINNIRIDSSSVVPGDKFSKTLYRRFHALLLWSYLADRDEFASQTKVYLKEAVSDISSSYFLSLCGLYKPARLSLRSGIENSFRSIISKCDNVDKYISVPDLVSACRGAVSEKQANRLSNLYSIYGDLCLTVHSVDIKYMSLKIPFDDMTKYSEILLRSNLLQLESCIKLINEILFVEYAKYLHLIDYRNADIIRDAVTAVVKGEVVALVGL